MSESRPFCDVCKWVDCRCAEPRVRVLADLLQGCIDGWYNASGSSHMDKMEAAIASLPPESRPVALDPVTGEADPDRYSRHSGKFDAEAIRAEIRRLTIRLSDLDRDPEDGAPGAP